MWITLAASLLANGAMCDLSLRIVPDRVVARPGDRIRVTASLTNDGPRTLHLVLPGDGSAREQRTPVIRWTIDPPRGHGLAGCGNISGLKPGEVFVLQPGETRDLGKWAWPLVVLGAGVYRATMMYSNEPDREFVGAEAHDEAELARVRASDRCEVFSSEVSISIEGSPVDEWKEQAVEQ